MSKKHQKSIDYSIIIPAYNEEDFLPLTLSSVQQAMETTTLSGELIVVDNNSDDTTAEIAKNAGAKVVFESHNQISRARNAGAANATGSYLVFIDADTTIKPELLQQALTNLQSGKYCGGGSIVTFDAPLNNVAGNLFMHAWNYIAPRRGYAAGSFVYCLKNAFNEIGGFSETVYASEEIWLSKKLRKWGKQHHQYFKVITEYPVITSHRKFKWLSPAKLYFMLFLSIIFPFFVRYRKLCYLWYTRPDKNKTTPSV